MKVLMFSTDSLLFEAGSEVATRLKEYGEALGEVHVVVATWQRFTPQKVSERVMLYPVLMSRFALHLIALYRQGAALIRKENITVITSQDPFENGVVAWLLKMRFHLPLQLQVHTDIGSMYFRKESIKNTVRFFTARFLLPRANRIRVVSERIKKFLAEKMPIESDKIDVLPIWVDVRKIQNKKVTVDLRERYPEAHFRLLMLSRLTKEKNIELAIRAVSKVQEQHPNILLVVVGDGPEKPYLQEIAGRHKVRIVFESRTKDIASYYKTADCYLLTSDYEGYGRTVIEAFAAGTPVIMTDVGCAGEILVNELDGLVVPVRDVERLAGAIRQYIEDSEKRIHFVAESQRVVQSLPIKEAYLAAYRVALEKTER